MRQKRWIKFAGGGLALVLVSLFALHKPALEQPATGGAGLQRVTYVYDGDTIKLDNGERVRLVGIDTPEAHDNDKLLRDVRRRHSDGKTQLAMGREAARFARSLLAGQQVRLEFDVEQRDKYGRLLAYLYLPDGTFVNEKIIREGYAYPLTIPPNVRHAREFKRWFDEAREAKRGLWSDARR
ncbi:MAG: thermonuclease family protein [Candidatus Omnitrophota bacterium]|nr:thermonuclease family protein [Candidatus Omnitrophota bacterium]